MYARVKKSFKGNFEGKFQRTPGEVYSRLPSRAQLEKTKQSITHSKPARKL